MLFTLLRELYRTPALDVIVHLKRSTGMTVSELAAAMKMSYMGVKQHCVELEKKGFLDTWRRPQATGRPEKLYRLTHKSDPLFPQTGNELTVDLLITAQRVYGETAAQKLLFSFFQARAERHAVKLRGKSVIERAEQLARMRAAEGCLSKVEYDAAKGGLQIVEYHTPFGEIGRKYPVVHELERQMFQSLLNHPVERVLEEASGLARIVFRVRTL